MDYAETARHAAASEGYSSSPSPTPSAIAWKDFFQVESTHFRKMTKMIRTEAQHPYASLSIMLHLASRVQFGTNVAPVTISELMKELDLSRNTVSRSLSFLEKKGLIAAQRSGKNVTSYILCDNSALRKGKLPTLQDIQKAKETAQKAAANINQRILPGVVAAPSTRRRSVNPDPMQKTDWNRYYSDSEYRADVDRMGKKLITASKALAASAAPPGTNKKAEVAASAQHQNHPLMNDPTLGKPIGSLMQSQF